MLVPFLHKQSNGNWIHVTTLNGYQLEALVFASHALKNHITSLQHLLLPVVNTSGVKVHSGFSTKRGWVNSTTRLTAAQEARTNISVVEDDHVIITDIFHSKHCLTCSHVMS